MADLTVNHQGRDYRVRVDSLGYFAVTVDDHTLSSETLKGLQEKVKGLGRKAKVKVSVPFVAFSGYTFKGGHATGIHARTNKLLVKWDGGGAEQYDYYHADVHLQPLTGEESQALRELAAAAQAAKKALDAFLSPRKFVDPSLRRAVEKEVKLAEERLKAAEAKEETGSLRQLSKKEVKLTEEALRAKEVLRAKGEADA